MTNMPNTEVINETIETAATTITEAAKQADKTGIIFMGLGFVGGIGLTFGAIKGAKAIKNKISSKKAAKLEKKIQNDGPAIVKKEAE